ncbi:hypothetical protein BKA82DRAFT_4365059 [Pisolithus tinctorius]|nr:hypothetical protein BKA82DRAFT_4365059 [Pisolithus tinctorius]
MLPKSSVISSLDHCIQVKDCPGLIGIFPPTLGIHRQCWEFSHQLWGFSKLCPGDSPSTAGDSATHSGDSPSTDGDSPTHSGDSPSYVLGSPQALLRILQPTLGILQALLGILQAMLGILQPALGILPPTLGSLHGILGILQVLSWGFSNLLWAFSQLYWGFSKFCPGESPGNAGDSPTHSGDFPSNAEDFWAQLKNIALMAITHHGINHADTGALMHCLFEEMVEILKEAAAVGGKDDCHSITENVIFGQLAPMGTGAFDVALDIDMLNDTIANYHFPVQDLLAAHMVGSMTLGQVVMTPYDTNSSTWSEHNFKGKLAMFSLLTVNGRQLFIPQSNLTLQHIALCDIPIL